MSDINKPVDWSNRVLFNDQGKELPEPLRCKKCNHPCNMIETCDGWEFSGYGCNCYRAANTEGKMFWPGSYFND